MEEYFTYLYLLKASMKCFAKFRTKNIFRILTEK